MLLLFSVFACAMCGADVGWSNDLNNWDWKVVAAMTEQDLRGLGVKAGHARKILLRKTLLSP
eukprot:2118613-Rhodomonas_salina.2